MEGTTVVASSLALSLSRAGRRTLLVDGDLRSPSLHKLFGMPLEEGMSEVLRSEIDLADAVKATNNEKLYLLTAGICDAEAIHALATEQPQAIFDKLREQFDFIVIDAPPVLGVSDSLSLGQYIDAAVLTVLRDHSEVRKVHEAAETLKRLGIRLLGCVVNGVPLRADRRVVRLHQASAHSRQPQLPAKIDG
jgi:capsular exopolysaccharide synthesis family protein